MLITRCKKIRMHERNLHPIEKSYHHGNFLAIESFGHVSYARNTCFDLTGKNDSIYESRRSAEEVPDNRNRLSDDGNDDDNNNEVSDNNDDDGDDYDEYDDDYEGPTKKIESFLKSEKIAMFMAKQNRTTLSSIGHQFEDMVLSCTYRGMRCGRVVK